MKVYAFIVMLLIGLLVPMTIASSSIDFDLNTVLFDNQEIAITVDVLKSVHLGKTKFMITREVAEGVQKRRLIGSKVVISLTAIPHEQVCPLELRGRAIIINKKVRYQAERLDTKNNKGVLLNAVFG